MSRASNSFYRFSLLGLAFSASLGSNFVQADAPGRNPQLVESPTVSPDGSRLVFAWRGDLWEASSEGGACRKLTTHPADDVQPRFSPDGTRLAFISNRHGHKQVFVMPADGGPAEQKSFHSEDYQLADWFPDGKSVLTLSARDHFWKSAERLIQVNVEERTAEKVLVDAHATGASVSPDGKSILVSREGERWWRKGYRGERASQIWKFDIASGTFDELLHDGYECRYPVWLPNGRGFYYSQGTQHGFDLWRYQFTRKADQPPRRKKMLAFDDDSIVQPTLSRDGKVLVFRHLFDLYRYRFGVDERPTRIELTIDDDAVVDDRLRRTFNKAEQVAFSEDGLDIAFTAGGDLWLMDTELKEPIQATHTAGEERDVVFGPGGKSLWFTRAVDGLVDIWKIEPKNTKLPWWRQTEFIETRITESPSTESDIRFTPDGKQLLYQESTGDLIVWDTSTNQRRVLHDGFGELQYVISPDSRWVAAAFRDEYFNHDVWLIPIDGSRLPTNVSKHPDNDGDPVFSPDGKILAFTGKRGDDEVDIHYVYLDEKYADESSRDRRMMKAYETLLKKRSSKSSPATANSTSKSNEGTSTTEKSTDKPSQESKPVVASSPVTMKVDLENIHLRVRKISTSNTTDRNMLFSPDSKRLLFEATIDGKQGFYAVEFPDKPEPKLFSTNVFTQARWTKASEAILGLMKEVPAKLETGDKLAVYSFAARHETSRSERYREGFESAWLKMRDVWYDAKMAGKNWDEIRRKYAEAAAEAPDTKTFTTVVEMMLGEINGSHLGFTPFPETAMGERERPAWRTEIAHLGVRWDETFKGPGLRVRDVLPDGPADRKQSRLQAGDIVVSIDGRAVDPGVDLIPILDGLLDRDVRIKARRAKTTDSNEIKGEAPKNASEISLSLRPISYALARELLYEHWLNHNRAIVEKQSEGKLGYLHIKAMDTASFHEFETQLYRVGYGRQGLIIDVRDNGGGSTTDYLLTALTQPQHAFTIPRDGVPGYPQDRLVFATWTKPIVVLCNQNSFSNAEIFSHAIKELGRGKVIGVQTAGGVVSTGAASITDLGTLRIPFRGWFSISTGKDMELRGALPDIVLWPKPTDLPQGIDPQLDVAIKELLLDVAKVKPRPPADYAVD